MRRNHNPQSQQFNERLITREYKTFRGMYEDIPNIPQGAMRVLDNYVAFNDRLEPRGGTRKWSTVKRPAFLSNVTMFKYSTPIPTGGYSGGISTVGAEWAGKYMVAVRPATNAFQTNGIYTNMDIAWPDNSRETILASAYYQYGATADDTDLVFIVNESDPQASTTEAEVWAPFCGWYYHQSRERIIWQFGYEFYISDESLTFLNKVYSRTNPQAGQLSSGYIFDGSCPANERSSFFALEDSVIALNKNGIFSIDLKRQGNEDTDIIISGTVPKTNFYTYHQVNTPIYNPSTYGAQPLVGVAKTSTKLFGYRYFYTFTELTNPGTLGGSTSALWNRTSLNVRIIRESPPENYSEIWTEKPVGDSTIKYATWIRTAALPAAFDTLAELKLISDGQFKVTMDGVQKNIKCDLTGATTYDEVASKMTSAVSAQFTDSYVEYDRTNSTFKIINPAEGGRITAIAAGDAGTTDFYTIFKGGTAAEGAEALVSKYQKIDATTTAFLYAPDHFTHLTLYRTLDIGTNGIDPVTGQGNNKELFIWVADYPLNHGIVDTGTFTPETGVTTWPEVPGGDVPGGFPYNVKIVVPFAAPEDLGFDYSDIGNRFFDISGRYFGIIYSITPSDTAYAIMNTPYSGSLQFYRKNASLSTPATAAIYEDAVPDTTLRIRIADFSCKNRLWLALPRYMAAAENNYDPQRASTNPRYQACGCFGLGFMLSSYRNENLIYYSQVGSGYSYLAGYGNQARQVIRLEDAIQWITFLVDTAIVFCRHSIWQIPLNNYSDVMYEDLGLSTAILSSQQEISREIGCLDWGSIKQVGATGIIFKASDGSIRSLQYSSGGISLSDSISKDQVQNRIMALSGISAACFDTRNGYLLWGKEETTNTLDQSFRFATDPTNGIGWALNSGSAWITPEIGCESITVFDGYGRHSTLVLDVDGYVYDISGQLSSSTGISRIRKDKAAVAGTGGTAIQTKAKLPEDTGTFEHYWQTHEESHVYFRPIDEALRRTSGYDSAGFPTTMEVDLTLYKDGEPTNYSAQAKDIHKTGDIFFDRIIRAHRLQLEIEVNNGEHIIVGTQQYYKSADQPSENSTLVSTEQEHQLALAAASARLGFSGVTVVNLQNGADAAATGMTATTDPTGVSDKALLTSSADAVLASGDLSADFSIMLAVQTIDNDDIIATNSEVTLKFTKAGSVYSVNFNDGTNNNTIALSWTGTGWLFLAVVRDGSTLNVYEAY